MCWGKFILQNVPKEEQERVSEYYFAQTTFALQTIYLELLRQEGIVKDVNDEITDFDKQWFEDALTAVAGFSIYGPPMYVELSGFREIQATGLQITKSPGKDIVYFGSTLLIIGVFFMFYVRQRRVWINIQPNSLGVDLNIAAKDNKNLPETEIEMQKIAEQIRDFANKYASNSEKP